jgi:predicted CxxxxCH...CXXCH cytochrome family protein
VVDTAADDGWFDDARTLECDDCHGSTLALDGGGGASITASVGPADAAGRHATHMANTNYVANGCADCHGHSGALGSPGTTFHLNGPANTDTTMAGKASAYNANDTCANSCHAVVDTRDWVEGTDTGTGTALACADCHDADGDPTDLGTYDLDQGEWPPITNAHAEHSASNALPNATQADCYACHNDTANNSGNLAGSSHLNLTAGDLVFNTTFNYEAGTAGRAAGTGGTTTCSAVACHNGATTPTWGAGTIACGQCHGNGSGPRPDQTANASIFGNHDIHADNDTVTTDDCVNCHTSSADYTATGGTGHQNLTVEITPGGSTYTPSGSEGGVNYTGGSDSGTCNNINCHYGASPVWGSAVQSAPGRCDNCHSGSQTADTLANAAPDRGWHARHVVAADSTYVDDCADCHGANDGSQANHGTIGDGPTFNTSVLSTWDSTNNTCTNTCHTAGNGDWDETLVEASQTGGLVCNDCHGSDLALDAVTTVGGAFVGAGSDEPDTGKHPAHVALQGSLPEFASGCQTCHPHSGALGTPGTTKHVDGGSTGLVTNVDLVNTYISAPTETTASWDHTCTNSCHNGGAGNEWTTGTLDCTDCHGGAGALVNNHTTQGQHDPHIDTTQYMATYDTASANNSTLTEYNYNCANCHDNTLATNHFNGSLDMLPAANYNSVAGTCSTNACHQDGQGGAPGFAPHWINGWAGDPTTDVCDNCHGNAPNSGAHDVHAMGIHSQDIYTGTSGLLAASGTIPSAHGDAGTSTVISCNTCHNATVDVWYNAYDSRCSSCHDTTNTSLGDNAMVVADKSIHADGVKTVLFQNITFKSKAQLRDDIASVPDVAATWQRTNGYKADNSYDVGYNSLQLLDDYTDVTCTTSCHNKNDVTWTTPTGDCSVCHTGLPQ